ncbi:glycosyl hydrolase [bacterium]
MKRIWIILIGISLLATWGFSLAQDENDKEKDPWSSGTFSGLELRNIGPAFSSGRISDLAVNPKNPSEYYVGVAAGNVWKTDNAGTTFKPIFDKYGAWSIASVVIDPENPHVVWVGTGEYNSQRAIGYGDGVYRSEDGGKSFKNMGLKKSEHIGRIVIDPRNSHVYVAAQGPLWGPGGERGLYKTTDQGKTWKKILDISENTGITDIVMDPRNPDRLYAASYQRRRRVFTLINGGPESAIYRSTDAGASWTKCKTGLPGGDIGRIGLAISPANSDYIYAIFEAEPGKGGFFHSTDRGATWKKQSDYIANSPQYYNRLIPDPKNPDKVYSLDTRSKVTLDGGKTWKNLGNQYRHVDDHGMWIDPEDTRHFLIGGDGGLYETWDNGATFHFKSNLPLTQFYRVSVDNSQPFYYVYGGTQDNNSMGGPSRTISSEGIVNDDWFVTNGGDGFESQIDPENPNLVYAQSQYGGLVRYDKQSGESISIKPQPPADEAYRWNWNAPLIISPHSHTRLYFAANKLFRSDDRGNTWKVISPDLTRQLDRNRLKVMGKIQHVDAPSKNASTSLFGNIVGLDESPLQEGLIFVGTDDGLIQITEDGGKSWRKIEKVKNVPEMTYVCFLLASRHDVNLVYAAFDGRKNNDLKPHLMKSTNKGRSWQSITHNLPDRGTVFCIAEDHVNPDLLFIGTEFALYFTADGGKKWIQMKGGLPVNQMRDLAIHKQENDLIVATFGRGFYILDDYTPLRDLKPEALNQESLLFPVKDALMYVEKRGKSAMGHSRYAAKNPPFGATFTYYLKNSIETLKQKRKKGEKEAVKNDREVPYPSWDALRAEDEQEKPYLLFTVKDEDGNTVRRLKASAQKGVHRIDWNLRYPNTAPVSSLDQSFKNADNGIPVMPGTYTVTMGKCVDGIYTELAGPVLFDAKVLNNTTLPAEDREALTAFQKKIAELNRAVQGASRLTDDLAKRVSAIRQALHQTPGASPDLMKQAITLEQEIREIQRILNGDRTKSRRNANQPPSISNRVRTLAYSQWRSTSEPTRTMKDQYTIAGEAFEPVLARIKKATEKDIKNLEEQLDELGAPWTPGRIPRWNK